MRNDYEIKREIFSLYDNARMMFNDLYNAKMFENTKYSDDEIKQLCELLHEIKVNIANIESELN